MIRTSTELPRLEPESSASANSAMAAKKGQIIAPRHIVCLQKKGDETIDWKVDLDLGVLYASSTFHRR
jgi:hypothetical protein